MLHLSAIGANILTYCELPAGILHYKVPRLLADVVKALLLVDESLSPDR